MDIVSRNRMMVFSGGANEPLAEEVVDVLGITLGKVERSMFANGEIYVRPEESVRGSDCFVIQSHSAPINDNIVGAVDHDRRAEESIRSPHHRSHSLSRLFTAGQEGVAP